MPEHLNLPTVARFERLWVSYPPEPIKVGEWPDGQTRTLSVMYQRSYQSHDVVAGLVNPFTQPLTLPAYEPTQQDEVRYQDNQVKQR